MKNRLLEKEENRAIAAQVQLQREQLPPEQSKALGEAARSRVPRESHSTFSLPSERENPVALLEAQAKMRISELTPIRYGRMLTSPFAFYCGASAIMAADLANTPQSGFSVQLCGDAHLSNFGTFALTRRKLDFDIAHFDETLPGPWEWDIKRLATSIEVAGRTRGCDEKECRALVLTALSSYRRAMQRLAEASLVEVLLSRLDVAKVLKRWGNKTRPARLKGDGKKVGNIGTQDNIRSLGRLTRRVHGRLRIASYPPLVVPIEEALPETEKQLVEEEMLSTIRRLKESLPGRACQLLDNLEYAHMARTAIGVSSVGLSSWLLLFIAKAGGKPFFLQLKEAQASALEPYVLNVSHFGHGERVVKGQRLLQAESDVFLGWEGAEGVSGDATREFYVRQLWDWKVWPVVEHLPLDKLLEYGQMCAWTLARAHARSGDRIAIAHYLGKGQAFDRAIAEFAASYADQNERDYKALRKAVDSGVVKAQYGV